jgi:SEC-C motif-containing protein
MRSRYAAFVKKDARYLYRTLHPGHDEHAQGEAAFISRMKRHFAERIVYRKLEVLDRDGPLEDGCFRVLFVAHMSQRGKDLSFAELSWFASDGVGLRYLSGINVPLTELGERRTIAAFTG